MSKSQRDKGAKGQRAAKALLLDRDYTIDQITAGISTEDFIATDLDGNAWSVEVKNCKTLTEAHVKQAQEQARKRKLPWMLMQKLSGSRSWLVRRQDELATVWHEKPREANQDE